MAHKWLRRVIIALVFLLASLLLYWSIRPPAYVVTTVPRKASEPGTSVSRDGSQLVESLALSMPPRLQKGERGEITLELDIGDRTASLGGSKNDIWLAVARLELPGVQISPVGEASRSMQTDIPLRFSWQVLPMRGGVYPGNLWLHGERTASNSNGAGERFLISVVPIELRVDSLVGLSRFEIQVLTVVGLILCLAIIFYRYGTTKYAEN